MIKMEDHFYIRKVVSMAGFVLVANIGELLPGEMKVAEIDGREVVLANVGGQIYAFQGVCTHRGGPLGEGLLMGEVVECPWHGGRFNVKTGEAVRPPPVKAIATLQVQVEGDDIKVARG